MNRLAARRSMRPFWILVHRYVGLFIAVFLLLAGLTGSILAFHQELDEALNADLLLVQPDGLNARPLGPVDLARLMQAVTPDDLSYHVPFEVEPGKAISFWRESSPEVYHEYLMNPYSGEILGTRQWGSLSDGRRGLISFFYKFHYSLALGEVGTLLFGIVALLWTIDCFVGAYLTLPERIPSGKKLTPRAWISRWAPNWAIKTHRLFSFVFTWHRASGLWVWLFLLVFAWSAVGLNLSQVYVPLTRATLGLDESVHDGLPQLSKPFAAPAFRIEEALELGRRHMRTELERHGVTLKRERWFGYAAEHGAFYYVVESDRDVSTRWPRTQVYFSAEDGKLLGLDLPTGKTAGNTLTSWINALHFASIGGVLYQTFVAIFGLLVAFLSVSGVWIWLKKSRKQGSERPVRRSSPAEEPGESGARLFS
jgi:uncharacterized iron-regulated membrane protein